MTAERQVRFWFFGLLTFLVLVFFLSSVLLPFVAGMAIAYLLDPVCDRLEAMGASRTLATSIVTLVFIIIVLLVIVLLVPLIVGQAARLLENLPGYFEFLRTKLSSLLTVIEMRVDDQMLEKFRSAVLGSADNVITWLSKAIVGVLSGGVAVVNVLSLLVITPVVTFYLLRDWDRIVEHLNGWLPRDHAPVIRDLTLQVDKTLSGFLRGQGMVCLTLGVFYALGLSIAGLDFGLIVGMIAGILSIVPYVGSIVGLALSVGLALVQFDSFTGVAIVAAVFFAGQILEGYVLTPNLVGDKVGLHPVWLIFGLLAGGTLFGFVGVMLAVPVAAVIGVGVRFGLGQYLASHYYRGSARDVEMDAAEQTSVVDEKIES
ncbi:AI-2E family transporter [Pelagibius sp. Alg239-R121]|uniref:AI-2E family transporter n=1 Tax=Pelagibius sp. Alg239-R121 TaxID=2993448 RepID=UPI0024A6E2E6|nr:AI-2E family transporter [Pelagibius sp. Alg239-R121]